ncbi:folliculin-interacting protein N-terminus-domain-containing protein [Mariannaea sp. PMI_226]|nr:folliculin-interacting protein N-terminus-domain-containing protein [Mariannaea sp. PMI_226]
MLGRLLHLGSGSSNATPSQTTAKMSRPVSSLESVQEDIHTRNLLFPDAQALYQHRNDQVFPLSTTLTTHASSTANAFDYSGDVDLDVRDVRVIIMQDALGPSNASLLFDSHPAPPTSPTDRHGSQDFRSPTSPRKSSLGSLSRPLVIQPDTPQFPRQGAFDRRASLQGRSQSHAETEMQRASREYREELATFSSCIFGNSELMSYKGTSTKVHVVPGDSRPNDIPSSIVGDGRSSIGRSSARSSRLSQSYSSQTVSPTITSNFTNHPPPRQSEKKKVLITRLFPVNLIVDDAESNTTPPSQYSDENVGFPFPTTGEESLPKKKKPKQRRTPMYAVVLVVQLPSPPPASRPPQTTQSKGSQRECNSYTDQEFFPSSFSSRPSGWTMVGSGTYDNATESNYSVDMEDRIDSLTQHWDIIMRTLTHLQSVVATILGVMLKQVDLASPGPFANSPVMSHGFKTPSYSDRRSAEPPRVKPPKSTTKLVSLWPNCLADDTHVAKEVDAARHRIVMGLSAARVVTGQGRWGIWRDEARWTSRWAANVDREQFFYRLLTGFLATHTDWLQALCPPSYRRRFFLQQKNRGEEDLSLPSRTVIVSEDKMVARRLIFLLSAFLPANQQVSSTRAHRPSTSTSVGTFSNSPPTFVIPVLREESLRRKINRRTGPRRASHTRTASHSASMRTAVIPSQLAHLSMDRRHERRVSDAASIRPSNLPMSGNDLVSRKSTAAITTTVMPETTVPHFSTVQRVDNHRRPRPSSSGSVAADDLKRSLKRGESTGALSNASSDSRSQSSRWGSVISGLWSARRRDTASMSSYGGSDPKSPTKSAFPRPDKLAQMVEEAIADEGRPSFSKDARQSTDSRSTGTPRDFESRTRETSVRPERTPDPNGAFESPVKTSINADDGVIDVDIAFPDYMTSFESAISSPSSSGYLSTPGIANGLDAFEQAARLSIDGDLPLNAAGWLNRFHPDFAVQAIPPQDDLMEQIKASLRAEPTPAPLNPLSGELSERWVDVSCVLVADNTKNSITRLRYRRLVKPRSAADRQPNSQASASSYHGSAFLTPSILPYETQLEEEWIEEQISLPDDALTEAIEKVVSLTQETSKDHSLASSHSRSESVRMSTDGEEPVSVTAPAPPPLPQIPLEVPRMQCKTVVLSSLEDTIREVIDMRERGEWPTNSRSKVAATHQNLLQEAISTWLDNLDLSDS